MTSESYQCQGYNRFKPWQYCSVVILVAPASVVRRPPMGQSLPFVAFELLCFIYNVPFMYLWFLPFPLKDIH